MKKKNRNATSNLGWGRKKKYEDDRKPLFYIIKLKKDEQYRNDKLGSSLLAFVLEGEMRMSTGIYVKEFVSEGQMFVVNKGDNGYIKCLKDTVMVFCRFDSSMALCNGLSLNNVSADFRSPMSEKCLKTGLPRLQIDKLLMVELNLTCREVESGLLGYTFMEFKRYVILTMIRTLYNKEQLFYMFSWVHSDDFDFREKVFQFYTCDINAQELCAKMEMSSATFNRRFKRAFGMPCGEWLNSKRQVQVLMDLKTTDLSVKEIAEKYNLTPNYLTDFCKKYLGDVPGNLR